MLHERAVVLRLLAGVIVFAGCGPTPQGAGGTVDAVAAADAVAADAVVAIDGPAMTGPDGPPPLECNQLVAQVRDFKRTHPDFESFTADGVYPGLVLPRLGPDGTPVYAPAGATPHTSGAASFAQWYHDTPDVNVRIPVVLSLQETAPGLYSYEAPEFFPIDGLGFGAQGFPHNFHFTTEIRTAFIYRGGEVFTFRGDDDLWLFINDRLAIDLGGLHQPALQTVDLDARAGELGLQMGHTYELAIFHAERHTTVSSFRIETTINCFIIP
jgi:fibro-slime domain-containing protein